MIVLRFKVKCQPEKTEQVMAALREVIAPARGVEGVISFDIARDLTDPNSFIATEVFEDEAARKRQESLPQVATVTLQARAGACGCAPSSIGPAQRVLNGRPIHICNQACGRSDGGTATSHEHCATDTSVTHTLIAVL